ncbi:outer membrane beta-barrel protein [Rufibacter sp. DG15C]|uniref:outer membrane beta-barrel protein n=1 Tax=Rufibacter sp. DG15C TaxID=1379909 RepID=UPI00082B13C8|nr:outer membrane beta-barrel protein [Rufibacter sp. DG15C]
MKKQSLLLLLLFTLSFTAFSQSTSVSGTVVGGGSPLIGATVALLKADSSVFRGAATDVDGGFQIASVPAGRYIVKASYLGFTDFYRGVTVSGSSVALGTLTLSSASQRLREVEVVGRAATVITKADTAEMNAAAYKVNKDANAENLIQKMPGVTIQNGQVQAQGERVQRVLVDGKEFFGEDPSAVLKNLPAEVISKIQVFDRQSDQSQFTGFSDGNEQKTINIITKPEFRTGRFGRVSVGAGTDDRYRVSGNINQFEGDRRISIVGLSNNVNEQNFSSEDLVGVASASSRGGGGNRGGGGQRGPGGGGFGGGGNNTGDFLVNTNNGIARTNAVGINYLDKWGKKVDVQGSYFFNHSNTNSNYSLYRDNLRQGISYSIYNENGITGAVNQNHRLNFRLTYAIDSANSIIVRPRISFQQNEGNENVSGSTISGSPITSLTRLIDSNLSGLNVNNNILYRHSFAKRGRTISFDVSTGYNSNDADKDIFSNTINGDRTNLQDQISILDNSGLVLGANVNYTEPLTDKTQLQLTYATNYNKSDGDYRTYERAENSEEYTTLVESQSSLLESTTKTQEFGTGWRYNNKDFQVMLNARYQYLTLETDQILPSVMNPSYKYHNVLPFGMLRYNFNSDRNVRIFYNGRPQTPSVDQLQSAIDKSNSLIWTQGNPALQQSFNHNFNVRYSAANPGKSSSFFIVVGGSTAQDYIGRETLNAENNPNPDPTDKTWEESPNLRLIRPVNLGGQYTMRTFLVYGLPVPFIKSNVNVNANASYTKNPGLEDGLENNLATSNVGGGLTLSSNISENLDFLFSTNATYNEGTYSLNKDQNNSYYNQSSQFRLNWLVWKGLNLTTELNHQYNGGLADEIDPTFLLWNGSVGYKFMKDRQAEIRLSAFDILGENTSIQQNLSSSYVEEVQTNVLQRYFMVSFVYNLRMFGMNNAKPNQQQMPGNFQRRGDGGMH